MSRASQRSYGIIYKITHVHSGKAYVGLTLASFRRRMQGHKSKAIQMGTSGGCRALNAAISKHGWDAFRKDVLYSMVPREFLAGMEIMAIAQHGSLYPNGYNLRQGGDMSPMLDPLVKEHARHVMQSREVKEKRAKVFAGDKFLGRVSKASRDAWTGYSSEERNKRAAKMAEASRKGWVQKREAKMAAMRPSDAKAYWQSLRCKGLERARRQLRMHPERYIGRDPVAEVMNWWGESFEARRRS